MAAGIGRVENGEIRPLRKGNYLFNRVLLISGVLMRRIEYNGSRLLISCWRSGADFICSTIFS